MEALGRHILVEFYECDKNVLEDAAQMERIVVQAARDAGATVINATFHQFSPVGTSGVVVIQESHLAIHTWPEFRYAAVDLFTCGDQVNPWESYKSLKAALKSEYASPMEMLRGQVGLLQGGDEMKTGDYAPEEIRAEYKRNVWFTEWGDDHGLSLKHRGDKLFDKASDFQRVEVYDTYKYGRMLTLDGLIMTTEKDEYVYHEMITHPTMQLLKEPKRVLVIGGGDGGTARELLRYKSIEEVVVVEIDKMVIDASKEFLPEISKSFSEARTNLLVADGIEYVKNAADGCFDAIFVDSTDPIGPAEGLFSYDFYQHVHRILRDQGVLVVQSESPRFNEKIFCEIPKCHKKIFGDSNVWSYLAYVPTYVSGMWSFCMASKGGTHPLESFNAEEAKSFSEREGLRYYNEDIHRSAFALPNFVRNMLNES